MVVQSAVGVLQAAAVTTGLTVAGSRSAAPADCECKLCAPAASEPAPLMTIGP